MKIAVECWAYAANAFAFPLHIKKKKMFEKLLFRLKKLFVCCNGGKWSTFFSLFTVVLFLMKIDVLTLIKNELKNSYEQNYGLVGRITFFVF